MKLKTMAKYGLGLWLLCLSTVVFATPIATILESPKDLQTAQLLYVLTAKSNSIQQVAGKVNTYRLTLEGVDPKVVYMSDHPQRFAGDLPLTSFLKQWTQGTFKDNPPNAVIKALQKANPNHKQARTIRVAVELVNPSYDRQSNMLAFEIQLLKGNNTALAALSSGTDVALFIDGGGWCADCSP